MTVAVEELERFIAELLAARGVASERASVVASLMAKADRYGVATHGVARLGAYVARIDAGVMELDVEPELRTDLPSAALLDARNGWGQVAAVRAMELAVAKAQVTGVGVVSIANSNHFGVAGHYAEIATNAGCIGIAMTNASPAMAPFNAKAALLGTNPIAFGVPVQDAAPIILDMSSSLVARGKIRRAFKEGAERIPEGWANDRDGRPTTDPAAALQGLLAPIGGAKGTGLALIIDILSGLLSGTAATGTVANINDASRPSGTGHLVIAIDPGAFIGRDAFAEAVAETSERITGMDASDGGRVLLPGQLEHDHAASISAAGVRVPADVKVELDELAARFGVTPIAERD